MPHNHNHNNEEGDLFSVVAKLFGFSDTEKIDFQNVFASRLNSNKEYCNIKMKIKEDKNNLEKINLENIFKIILDSKELSIKAEQNLGKLYSLSKEDRKDALKSSELILKELENYNSSLLKMSKIIMAILMEGYNR